MSTFVIAEIGQNHNGSVKLAMDLVRMAAMPIFHDGHRLKQGDAVKFTVRDLDYEMTPSMYRRAYDSPNAFAKTYGEHRRALELPIEDICSLSFEASLLGLRTVVTVCSPTLVERVMDDINPYAFKVASRDIDNVPLLRELNKTHRRVILSTGMSGFDEIDAALRVLDDVNVAILHCLSVYPAPYDKVDLRVIEKMRSRYPGIEIGYSDHTTGVLAPAIAVALGATIIEKHITLDRKMKGTDHAGAVDMEGFRRVVRDIRNTELALGIGDKVPSPDAVETGKKLRRSLAAKTDLPLGHIITEDDLAYLSPGTGYRWEERGKIIGKVCKGIKRHELFTSESVE